MKILMVSMFSSHFFNWVKQLENEGHEIYWIDAYDANTFVEKIDFVHQIVGWRNRFKYPGRYTLKNYFPGLYNYINRFNEQEIATIFEEKLKEFQPDVVQSFEMFSSAIPIMEVMERNPGIPWIYSVWGNDLFHFKNNPQTLEKIQNVLQRINFLFTDCARDMEIAEDLGFGGCFLGVYPTGGGYDFKQYDSFIKKIEERKLILIKGYQHQFGRCNKVLEALIPLKEKLSKFDIVIFGANKEVLNFAEKVGLLKWKNIKIHKQLSHEQVLKLMGEAEIYIGNSISDGMPNTLLEAIIMGAFPIQSNPGGVTEEIIKNGMNGFLINNPENSLEIETQIISTLENDHRLKKGVQYNMQNIKPTLERQLIRRQVIEKYKFVEIEVNSQKRISNA